MTPQDTMRLALEALEEAITYTSSPSWSPSMTNECKTAIDALKTALSQQGAYTDPDCLTRQDEIIRKLAKENAELDSQIDQLIQERDHRDEIIDKLCDAVLGPDRYEWSSMYFFEDAVREVEERMEALAQQGEQQPLQAALFDCDIQPRPLAHPLRDYHFAPSEGPLNYTWQDKPHRLLYDLIAAVRYYTAAPAAQPHVTPNQAARFRAQHLFLEWNRAQKDSPVAIAMEYHVFQNAIDLYFEAVKLNGIGVRT